jgi:hypothetical protein
MTPAQRFELADKDVHHWLLILAGHLSSAQRNYARLELIRAVGRRVRARLAIEEAADEVGIAA